jgi:type III pantothenate kinase
VERVKMRRILAIDRGNDSVKAALFESGRIIMRWKAEGRPGDIVSWVDESGAEGAAVSSVVGSWERICADTLARAGLERVLFVGHETPLPFVLKIRRPETVGPDRLCAAAAVACSGAGDAVIVDAGTAVTVDLLEGGELVGGSIMPGIDMMLGSLSDGTSALPRIRQEMIEEGLWTHPPGDDTESAILSGVYTVFRSGAAELVRLSMERARGELPVYLTGGGAGLLEDVLLPRPILSPDLVLDGLNCIYSNTFL